VIAFVGSVFSPYYAWARRRGRMDPHAHCAVNVALYGDGGHRWAMTERGQANLLRRPEALVIGPSSMTWRDGALVLDLDEVTAPRAARYQASWHPSSNRRCAPPP
jgi:carotenoid 1,2-hydratase